VSVTVKLPPLIGDGDIEVGAFEFELHSLADVIDRIGKNTSADIQTCVFAVSRPRIRLLMQEMTNLGVRAAAISGDDTIEVRQGKYNDFHEGRLSVLVVPDFGVVAWSPPAGTDFMHLELPTYATDHQLRQLMAQRIGRINRLRS
jgi:superfamily II DNA or RNA helicase